MRTLIVSGGHIDDAFATEWIKEHSYDRMIAADRGMEFFHRNGITPDAIVGDFDSVSTEALEFFRTWDLQEQTQVEIVTLNPIKDDTDTEFAIRKAIAEGASEITLLGATGTRLDHVLGNIELLGIGLEKGIEIELVDDHNRIRMINGPLTFEKKKQFGKYVSLIPVTTEVTGVTLEGFRYPLQNDTLNKFSSLGISNEIAGEIAKLTINEGILLVIESRD